LVVLLVSDSVDRNELSSFQPPELALYCAGADVGEIDDLVCVKAPVGVAKQDSKYTLLALAEESIRDRDADYCRGSSGRPIRTHIG
jgi:hypothetical protein